MRRILVLLFFAFILSGCATYKFQKSGPSASQGYVATYDGKPLLEYTVGKEKTLPDLTLAKERFKRRRGKVEYYYKNMGQISSRMKEFLWEPPAMFVGFVGGVLRWPFIAYADYKYNRDPKYREKVDKLDEQKDALEKARVNSLREKLNAYINEDLAKESLKQGQALPAAPKVEPPAPESKPTVLPPVEPQTSTPAVAEEKVTAVVQPVVQPPKAQQPAPEVQPAPPQPEPAEVKPVSVEVKPIAKPSLKPPVAVIIAKPAKGYSPLKVNFSGEKSRSKSGRIVSYDWDFGDGDTSAKKNPENTYWSTTYGARNFTVTLTVRDDAGNTSSASTIIEVSTH